MYLYTRLWLYYDIGITILDAPRSSPQHSQAIPLYSVPYTSRKIERKKKGGRDIFINKRILERKKREIRWREWMTWKYGSKPLDWCCLFSCPLFFRDWEENRWERESSSMGFVRRKIGVGVSASIFGESYIPYRNGALDWKMRGVGGSLNSAGRFVI